MDRIGRKDPVEMADVMKVFLREARLAAGVNTQRVYKAWDDVSGAAAYTLSKYFKDGVLYVTVGSSVARNNLYFQKESLARAINDRLMQDSLFDKESPDARLVRSIVLK